ALRLLPSFPTRRSSDLQDLLAACAEQCQQAVRGNLRERLGMIEVVAVLRAFALLAFDDACPDHAIRREPRPQLADERGIFAPARSEEHTSELQSRENLV